MPSPKFDQSQPFESETTPLRFDPSRPFEADSGPKSEAKMGPWEAALHGAGESIPFGRQTQAGIVALLSAGANGQSSMGDAYRSAMGDETANLAKAEQDQGLATLGGKLFGGGFSMAALAPAKAASLGAYTMGALGRATPYVAGGINAGLYGLTHGLGEGGWRQAAIEAPGTALMGAAAEGVAPAASYVGGKLGDLAGWLKVNSIHPTPTLGEAMEALPGGNVGLGRTLLGEGIGGLTKGGTYAQTKAAASEAGREIGEMAALHDVSGGAPVDLRPALAKALNHAQELQTAPTVPERIAAGKRLEELVYDQAKDFGGGPVPATRALELKRVLGESAYGNKDTLAKAGDLVSGHYGKGVGVLERAVDDALDSTVGPEFGKANLKFRQLLGAENATERQASRGAGNRLGGLIPWMAGLGGYQAHGRTGAAAGALGAMLLDKYGSQFTARTLYGLGRGLEMAPDAATAFAARSPQVATSIGNASPALGSLLASYLAQKNAEGGGK